MGCSAVLGIEEWKDPPLGSTGSAGSSAGGSGADNQDEDAGPAAPTCSDGQKNGSGETDVDCGGSECPPCGVAQTCKVNSDCLSANCSAMTGTCVIPVDPPCTPGAGDPLLPASCKDCLASPGESDIDCGGSACARCWTNKKCGSEADCMSGSCMSGRCDPGATGKACRSAYDCLSAECDPNGACL